MAPLQPVGTLEGQPGLHLSVRTLQPSQVAPMLKSLISHCITDTDNNSFNYLVNRFFLP